MGSVAITGMGVISPVGNSLEALSAAIRDGICGIAPPRGFSSEVTGIHAAGEVADFDAAKYISRRELRRMDRFAQFAYTAAQDAFAMAGLDGADFDPWRAGIVLASGMGGLDTVLSEHEKMLRKGPAGVSPLFIPKCIINSAAGAISMSLGLKGGSYGVVTACASGTDAIGQGYRLVRSGAMDIVLAGGAESVMNDLAVLGFANMGALSTQRDPRRACRPFDRERDGFVMGEGAGFMVLEDREHAMRRGARILGGIAGYAHTSDAYHITAPEPTGEGAIMSMRMAMREGGVNPDEIGYINAHGTSTPLNDKVETLAIRRCFEGCARPPLVSSTKSMTGHLLGAAGAVEAIFTVLSLSEGLFPATLGLRDIDEECALNHIIEKPAKNRAAYALSNSLGFGGHNSTLLIAAQ